ncbi:polyphosphate:AMP phosphotransferase [Inmirania thermothiophila]|uniref:Polyphosphate:AMP phosphotransferase n=1 Tax=Inmirania thermothiophila TaxID=1750597 RepID=A0A3N1Y6V7_9GAMM|nr:polyphosphate:AMP phosphotransferase [Inmirania thermothiophila]ROR34261.1 polyphosphate:AMP phosphotransferase [Inmirania thermothiophila]
MFEAAELGRKVAKAEFRRREAGLRLELLELQQALRGADFPVLVLFGGVDGAGKGEIVNLLNAWMDPRWIVTEAFGEPSDEERERPPYWRYWRALAPRGRIGLYLSAWTSPPLLARAYGELDVAAYDEALERIAAFERTLAEDGALIVKFWLHLGREAQKRRFRRLEKDPLTRWRVTERDWRHWRMYDDFVAAAERLIRRTDAPDAPWHVVEGTDLRHAALTVGETLRDAMRRRLETPPTAPSPPPPAPDPGPTVLSRIDLGRRLDKARYRRELARWQGRLAELGREAAVAGVSTVVVFEGWDAAGKGGAIRRLTAALDARRYRVVPVAVPTDEERAHHYLWRFWRHLPRAGRMVIFDRSWYGRVLVERVEGLAPPEAWRRAYGEINDFEEQLVEHGTVLVKLWLHISDEEQLRRFRERAETPHKRWKLTDEDWRNRERRADYERAVHEMVQRTSTTAAPWTLVAAEDKRHARVEVLRTVCGALARRLEG